MSYKHIKYIFFDLDHTLWDFESSSVHTLQKMFEHFNLEQLGIPQFRHFIDAYHIHNERLWELYRSGNLRKEVLRGLRFWETLNDFHVADEILAEKMSDYYLFHAPRTVFLFPYTLEVLRYLYVKYPLFVITNGFEEVQHIKMQTSGMDHFFSGIITSEAAGVKKPAAEIFQHALQKAQAKPEESLMIGDDLEVDVLAALNIGMEAILFDPENKHVKLKNSIKINSLKSLISML